MARANALKEQHVETKKPRQMPRLEWVQMAGTDPRLVDLTI
jgi:hypothetical protein